MERKCIQCGVTEDDVLYFDGRMDRPRPVRLTDSRYGLLCQRHVKNAYARATTRKKRKAREVHPNQMDMFAGMETD